jgi:phenylalanine ammonia-lyase
MDEVIKKLQQEHCGIEPGQSFGVDTLKPEDAWGVARCFFSSFGAGYAFKMYFDPDYLLEADRTGAIRLAVARTDKGDIVGCGVLYRSSAPNPKVYELGRYVVLPEYRNTDVALNIQDFVVDKLLPGMEVDQVFGEAVCHQVFDQKFWAMSKFRETAIEVGLMPAAAYGLEGDRVSTLLQFHHVKGCVIDLYIPAEYQEAMEYILGGLSLQRRVVRSDAPVPLHHHTRTACEYYDFAQVARVNVVTVGSDFLKTVQGLEVQAEGRGVRMQEVFLNLGESWTGHAITQLRERGYFFGGFLPHWFGSDGLLMQKVLDMPDLDAIKLFSERAHRILGFIRKDIESNPACLPLRREEKMQMPPPGMRDAGDALAIHEVVLMGAGLTIDEVAAVARWERPVRLTDEKEVIENVDASAAFIRWGVRTGEPIYGVNTGFGGMANVAISEKELCALQNNLIRFLQAGAGDYLHRQDVRAAILARANSHMRGVSGIRRELIERMLVFLNHGATPVVRDMGSIGASGDLVPLATITGAIIGADPSFEVDLAGERLDALTAIARLGLAPLQLGPKEGLAMVNGTSVMTGIAANCLYEARQLIALALACHALYLQALRASNQSFHPFVQQVKPHPGQVWTAARMLELLRGSRYIRHELDGHHESQGDQPVQDRYSLRCLPQYFGPIIDGFRQAVQVVEVELNSASDNPLIDGKNAISYHTGNFLGQYIGVWMDHLRYYLGLLAKHLDTQIALLVAPEFSGGLTPSLVGNPERGVNMGLKGLQISANSMMPLLSFYGNSIADRYPTHAEQFNQNINSQGFNSALLARKSVGILRSYLSAALIFGVQSVELRAHQMGNTFDARQFLSSATIPVYEAVYAAIDRQPSVDRPLIWDDDQQPLDRYLTLLAEDISREGHLVHAVKGVIAELSVDRRFGESVSRAMGEWIDRG